MDNPAATPRSAPPPTDDAAGAAALADSPPAESMPADGEPGGTETPSRPTDDDVALLAFAQSFELTARDLYQTVVDNDGAGDYADVFDTLRQNHEEYGNVLAGIIGVDAPQRRDDAIFDQFSAGFEGGSIDSIAQAAYDLESTAVATHTDLIGQLEGLHGATTLAALLVVEARHCTVLAHIGGRGDDLAALIDDTGSALPLPAEG